MRRVRHTRQLLLAALAIVSLSGCATTPAPTTNPTAPTPLPSSTGPLSSAPQIVTFDAVGENGAWVVTDRGLLVTVDGGLNWRTLPAADVTGVTAILASSDEHVVMAGIDGRAVVVRTTADGGQTWQQSRLHVAAQPGDVRLAAGDSLLALLVQETTSSNFSEANLVVARSGEAFQTRPAPAAGSLSITGPSEIWLAGGVLNNQLWHSGDAGLNWTEVHLPSSLGTTIGVGAPVRVSGGLLLAVTLNGPVTREAWLTSRDAGATWQQLALESIGGETGQGVAAPASAAGDRVIVAGPAGGLFAVSATGEALTPVSPNGLPAGVAELRFTSTAVGWAFVRQGSCESGKSGCVAVTGLYRTGDGGQTWREAQLSR